MLFSIRSVWASEKSPKLIPKSRIIGFKCQRLRSTIPPFKTIHESSGQIGSDGRVEFIMSLDSLNPTDVKKSQHRLTHLALCEFFLLQRDDKMGASFTCPTSSQLYVCMCVCIYIYYLYIEFNRYYTNLIYNMFLLYVFYYHTPQLAFSPIQHSHNAIPSDISAKTWQRSLHLS